jgi:hypothetical protein
MTLPDTLRPLERFMSAITPRPDLWSADSHTKVLLLMMTGRATVFLLIQPE